MLLRIFCISAVSCLESNLRYPGLFEKFVRSNTKIIIYYSNSWTGNLKRDSLTKTWINQYSPPAPIPLKLPCMFQLRHTGNKIVMPVAVKLSRKTEILFILWLKFIDFIDHHHYFYKALWIPTTMQLYRFFAEHFCRNFRTMLYEWQHVALTNFSLLLKWKILKEKILGSYIVWYSMKQLIVN